MTTLPTYVIDGNLYDALAAVQLCDVVMHNFCVQADQAKLQAWLDKTFAGPSGGAVRYRALGDKVFLGIAEIGKLYTLDGSNASKGYTSEIDITLWILAQREDDGLFALRWIPAYLFVDSGPALVSGREVWGFPKQLGRFDFSPQAPRGGAQTFSADGWVVSPYGPDSKARWATMFEARPVAAKAAAPATGMFANLEALAARTVERLTGELTAIAGRLQAAVGGGGMTMAFLKQFPDAADPQRACYQAVVEADAQVTAHRGSGLTDQAYEVRITTFATHPYLSELGISPDWQEVGQGIWMDFDFQQALGREVWRAGPPA
ncbi:MAG: hypothetical protein ACHP9T_14655 [Caulobacterales bacterium]